MIIIVIVKIINMNINIDYIVILQSGFCLAEDL